MAEFHHLSGLPDLLLPWYRENRRQLPWREDRLPYHVWLSEILLQQTRVQKTYHALVYGGPEEDNGIIDAPIARRPLPSLLRYVGEEGKPSVTRWQVLQRQEWGCKLALEPVTGRTHQLRVHCAYKGFPILGDPQYASPASQELSEKLGLTFQLLCAKKLELIHPMTGETMELTSRMDAVIGGEKYAL